MVLWEGGCPRDEFSFAVDTVNSVRIHIVADNTVAHSGLVVSWTTLAEFDEVLDEVINVVPCPTFEGLPCGGNVHGSCDGISGQCVCSDRFLGEDCGSPVWCPGPDMCAFLHTLVVVAPNGRDDTESTGDPGNPTPAASGGRPPKPVASVKKAVELANIWDEVFVYPGLYTECGATLETANVRVISLTAAGGVGFGDAVFECGGTARFLSTTAENTVVRVSTTG